MIFPRYKKVYRYIRQNMFSSWTKKICFCSKENKIFLFIGLKNYVFVQSLPKGCIAKYLLRLFVQLKITKKSNRKLFLYELLNIIKKKNEIYFITIRHFAFMLPNVTNIRVCIVHLVRLT